MQIPFLTGKSDRKQKAKSLYSICTHSDSKMSAEYVGIVHYMLIGHEHNWKYKRFFSYLLGKKARTYNGIDDTEKFTQEIELFAPMVWV